MADGALHSSQNFRVPSRKFQLLRPEVGFPTSNSEEPHQPRPQNPRWLFRTATVEYNSESCSNKLFIAILLYVCFIKAVSSAGYNISPEMLCGDARCLLGTLLQSCRSGLCV